MNLDAEKVIEKLAEELKKVLVDRAILQAQVEQLMEEKKNDDSKQDPK